MTDAQNQYPITFELEGEPCPNCGEYITVIENGVPVERDHNCNAPKICPYCMTPTGQLHKKDCPENLCPFCLNYRAWCECPNLRK